MEDRVVDYLKVKIAGNSFMGSIAKTTLKNLKKDTVLYLKREPSNEHDSNAIQIVYLNEDLSEIQLGFVPRVSNSELAHLMDTKSAEFFAVYRGECEVLIKEKILNKETTDAIYWDFDEDIEQNEDYKQAMAEYEEWKEDEVEIEYLQGVRDLHITELGDRW